VTCLPEHGIQMPGDRAFAVRAADMHDAKAAVRIIDTGQQPAGAFEAPPYTAT
jgi:hypothetical protein